MNTLTDLHLLILEKGEITCQDVEDLMGDYVDGDLTPTLKTRIDDHMAECSECREFYRTYSLTVRLAKSLKEDRPMPVSIQNRFRAALNEKLGISLPSVSE